MLFIGIHFNVIVKSFAQTNIFQVKHIYSVTKIASSAQRCPQDFLVQIIPTKMITPNNYGHFLNLTSFLLSFDLSRAYSRQNNCLALLDHVKITDLQITTGLNPLVSLIKSRLLTFSLSLLLNVV